MTASDFSEEARLITAARRAARRAAMDLAVEAGASVITRPAHPGARPVIRDVGPIPGLRAAREIELGAQHVLRNYIRDAREAGHSWHQIGTAMRLQPARQPGQEAETAAEAAFTYAAGRPDSATAWRYGQSFSWTCASCNQLVIDRGPFNGPADAERGHDDRCARRTAEIADWEAQWEAGD